MSSTSGGRTRSCLHEVATSSGLPAESGCRSVNPVKTDPARGAEGGSTCGPALQKTIHRSASNDITRLQLFTMITSVEDGPSNRKTLQSEDCLERNCTAPWLHVIPADLLMVSSCLRRPVHAQPGNMIETWQPISFRS